MLHFYFNPGKVKKNTIIAIIAVKDEASLIKGLFENIASEVDGVIVLEDGASLEVSREVGGAKEVLKVIRNKKRRGVDYDVGKNVAKLIRVAKKFYPEWILLIDPDERLEKNFRKKVNKIIGAYPKKGGLTVRLRELWNGPDTFRVDGAWGEKYKFAMFKNKSLQVFSFKKHHNHLFPLGVRGNAERIIFSDINMYHLKMISRKERVARCKKFKTIDPNNKFQKNGYDYLIDERGVELVKVDKNNDYR